MDKLQELKKIIADSQNIVFFGGAGVSTESNIRDFRSQNGILNSMDKYGYPPELILSHPFFEECPAEFYNFYFDELEMIAKACPNQAHWALAKLERQGKLKGIVSQNIDDLHQAAGSKNVWQLHGSVSRNYCLNCGATYPPEFILAQRPATPHCLDCGCLVRPDIVLYEESLDPKVMRASQKLIANADVLLIGGTSLSVYPAAGLIEHFHGSKLILINKAAIDQDIRADLVFNSFLGEILAAVAL